MDVVDMLAIRNVIESFGHIVDLRQLGRLGEVFAEDAVYEATRETVTGLEAIKEFLSHTSAVVAHHQTNVTIVDASQADRAVVLAKWLAVRPDHTCGTGTYTDHLERRAAGWRVVRRVVTTFTPPWQPLSSGP